MLTVTPPRGSSRAATWVGDIPEHSGIQHTCGLAAGTASASHRHRIYYEISHPLHRVTTSSIAQRQHWMPIQLLSQVPFLSDSLLFLFLVVSLMSSPRFTCTLKTRSRILCDNHVTTMHLYN